MTPTPEQLVAIVSKYWPSEMDAYIHPDSCPEFTRKGERWQQELARMDRWESFIRELRTDMPGRSIGNITATPDACLRCGVYSRGSVKGLQKVDYWVVVGCMSILAPVYTVYAAHFEIDGGKYVGEKLFFGPFPPEMQPVADAISRRLEATFDVSRLPREVAEMPVPLCVEPLQPPDTTLFHALFTSVPGSIP